MYIVIILILLVLIIRNNHRETSLNDVKEYKEEYENLESKNKTVYKNHFVSSIIVTSGIILTILFFYFFIQGIEGIIKNKNKLSKFSFSYDKIVEELKGNKFLKDKKIIT